MTSDTLQNVLTDTDFRNMALQFLTDVMKDQKMRQNTSDTLYHVFVDAVTPRIFKSKDKNNNNDNNNNKGGNNNDNDKNQQSQKNNNDNNKNINKNENKIIKENKNEGLSQSEEERRLQEIKKQFENMGETQTKTKTESAVETITGEDISDEQKEIVDDEMERPGGLY